MTLLSHVVASASHCGQARAFPRRTTNLNWFLAALAAWLPLLRPKSVHAESAAPVATDRAEQLFLAGRAAIREHRLEEACADFDASARLDRTASALLNLAACREAQGRTASAWRHYRQGRERSVAEHNEDGVRLADARIAALEPVLCRVVVLVAAGAAERLQVELDSEPLPVNSWGSAQPLDPGTHVVRASAPGYEDWSSPVELFERGQLAVVTLPPLDRLRVIPPARARSQVPAGPAVWPLYTSAAVTGAAFLATAYFGLSAASEWTTRNRNCTAGSCNQTAVEASDRAAIYARVADESAVVGLLAAAATAYFAVTRQRTSERPQRARALDIFVGPAGIRVGGEL